VAAWKIPTARDRSDWGKQLAELPPDVRRVASRFPPWCLYRHCGYRVSVIGVGRDEDGHVTLEVNVCSDFNLVPFSHNLRGVEADDLIECDLPKADERVGAVFNWRIEEDRAAISMLLFPLFYGVAPDGRAMRRDH
jgi:hypothetical protein